MASLTLPSAFLVVAGAAVAVLVADLGDGGHVDGEVAAAVAAPGQPEDDALAGGDLDRAGAVVGGEPVSGGKAGDVGDLAEYGGGDDRADAEDAGQRGTGGADGGGDPLPGFGQLVVQAAPVSGAVNALALAAKHPEQIRTLVAHEPPTAQELPDRAQVLAVCAGIKETYLHDGFGPAMAKFIAYVSYQGPIPAGFAEQPGPDSAMFGLPTGDDGSRDDALPCLNMPSCPVYRPDFNALRAASCRIVLGVGADSANVMPGRAAAAVAEGLNTTPVTFPGGHGGFARNEYERTNDPDAFATTLRTILAS
jgi:hypothetical protein